MIKYNMHTQGYADSEQIDREQVPLKSMTRLFQKYAGLKDVFVTMHRLLCQMQQGSATYICRNYPGML